MTRQSPSVHAFHNFEQFSSLTYLRHESPLSKADLCRMWLKLAHWFWRRRFLKFVNIFSLFHKYLPLEKDGALHLNKVEFPSLKDDLCQA